MIDMLFQCKEWEFDKIIWHSEILLTCIKRYLVLNTNWWSSFKWPLKTGFTVFYNV